MNQKSGQKNPGPNQKIRAEREISGPGGRLKLTTALIIQVAAQEQKQTAEAAEQPRQTVKAAGNPANSRSRWTLICRQLIRGYFSDGQPVGEVDASICLCHARIIRNHRCSRCVLRNTAIDTARAIDDRRTRRPRRVWIYDG